MPFFALVRRAFTSNLKRVSASHSELARLQAAGIVEPAIQRYFVWRRSIVVIIVLATILSAGFATVREFTEEDAGPTVAQAFVDRLVETSRVVPGIPKLADLDEESIEEDAQHLQDLADNQLSESSSAETSAEEPVTTFGWFADCVHLASLYALPLSAVAVVFFWTRLKLSFQILLAGFAFSFFVPILLALCPWSWWGYVEPNVSATQQPAQYYGHLAEGVLEGAAYLVALLPTVLSLIPGVQRACLRVKTLLPESMLPGWFLVSAAPFYALFLLVIFVAVNQVASHPMFLVGMFLFLSAPLVYVLRSDVFTSPLLSEDDYDRMRRVQRIVGGITLVAGILLTIYMTTQTVFGVHLIGTDRATSLLRPADLVEYLLEFIGRSMFMTVLGADLFMRMNLRSWKNSRSLIGAPESAAYDRVMSSMELVAS